MHCFMQYFKNTLGNTGVTCLEVHIHFCDPSPQRPNSNSTAHGRCSYLAIRQLRAVYHAPYDMTSHDIGCMGFLNGMVTGQFHSTQH